MGFIPREKSETSRLREDRPNYVGYWSVAVIIGLIFMILIKIFVAKGYYVTTENMTHNLLPGDMVLVEKISTRNVVERETILCFNYPAERSQYRFGRAVAKGLDIVEIINKQLYVNGRRVALPPGAHFADNKIEDDPFSLRDNFGPFTVPEGHYFIMGDNRDNAIDSRYYGTLSYQDVLGKPLFVYFSWKLDDRAPDMKSLMNIPEVLIYNLTHLLDRMDLGRIGKSVR